ncbi:Zinc finger MYM-type protein 1 [Frankliniella fusca]|uniref:Zinc finger MYM-type protein 1 n=1 Tax=Frankliniella fusca TaxID=407009 RepID=A0AAE1LLT2_9NEOP|nr:Zinc finger MYM-type protein 1 [Frankliniella fusca]
MSGFRHPFSGQRGIKSFFSSLNKQQQRQERSARVSTSPPIVSPPPTPAAVEVEDSDPDDDFLTLEETTGQTQDGAQEGSSSLVDSEHAAATVTPETTATPPPTPPPLHIPAVPYQPAAASIPPYVDNRRKHNFIQHWYKDFPWLHYEAPKGALCFTCLRADRNSLVPQCIKKEPAFVTDGVFKWKEGAKRFANHENSQYHKAAVHATLSLGSTPVSAQISSTQNRQQAEARVALRAIFTTLQKLAQQGLAIRGKTMENSNLLQMLELRAQDITELDSWLKRRVKFLSPEVQNEILELMAHQVLRDVISEVKKCGKYSVIMDECRDTSNTEQVAVCLRTVDMGTLQAVEYFLGLYQTASTTGQCLTDIFLDVLKRSSLDLSDLSGQCFDGASNMKGEFKGVQARLKEMQPLALFVHCFNHSLNLALQDTMKRSPSAREALQWVHDVGVIVNRSPKRRHALDALRESFSEQGGGPTTICPTRWTVRVRSIMGLLNSYRSVLTFLQDLAGSNTVEIVESGSRVNVSAKAKGLHTLKKEKNQN